MSFKSWITSVPSSESSGRRFLWVGFAALCFAHLFFINHPTIDADEPGVAHYALYGTPSVHEAFIPKGTTPESFFNGYGRRPGYVVLVWAGLRLFGFGLWQMRLLPLLAALAALGLLLAVAIKNKAPVLACLFLLSTGFWNLFFHAMHMSRPEGPLLLIFAVNLAWYLGAKNPWTAPLYGFLMAMSFFFHPVGVCLVVVMGSLMACDVSRERLPVIMGWAGGWIVGLFLWMHVTDFSEVTRHLVQFGTVVRPTIFKTPDLITVGWKLWLHFFKVGRVMVYSLMSNAWNPAWSGLVLSTLVIHWRRLHTRSSFGRTIVFAATFTIVFISALSAARNLNYTVLAWPLLMLQAGLLITRIITGEDTLDHQDLLLFAGCFYCVWLATLHQGWAVFGALPFLLWALWNAPKNVLTAFIVGMVLAATYEYRSSLELFMRQLIVNGPLGWIYLLCAWGWPVVVGWIGRRWARPISVRPLVLAGICCVALGWSVAEACAVYNEVISKPTRLHQMRTAMAPFTKEERLLANHTAWFAMPSANIQFPPGGFRGRDYPGQSALMIPRYRPTAVILGCGVMAEVYAKAQRLLPELRWADLPGPLPSDTSDGLCVARLSY